MSYGGTVLDEGRDFAAIETEGSMVILKVTFNGDLSSATFDVAMSDDQAREVARHLMAAAEWVSPTRPEGL